MHLQDIAAQTPAAMNYAHLGVEELPQLLRAIEGYAGSKITRVRFSSRCGPRIDLVSREHCDGQNLIWTTRSGRSCVVEKA